MLEMEQKGTGVDITTVYSALRKRKTAELVGGITYLSKLMDETIVVSNAKYYAETVGSKSRMRQLIAEAEKIRESAYSDDLPPEDILDSAEQRILEIAHKSQRSSYVDINEVLFQNIKQLQELLKAKREGKIEYEVEFDYVDDDMIPLYSNLKVR
jgi:replicative DNA helicase